MSDVVNSAGWRYWNVGDERTDHVYYKEFRNTGTGASGTRVCSLPLNGLVQL